ncbi:hypothetical protein PPL_00581 [Heterostelium album PN500]|uniref:Uncharacterized protein n=1 Tax=Heterostelium pallidum (strain ATCC 26659 / Pp 5 / PN500) TaxID=670386 RepID=D3AWV3_HETP5|nr:hypothetical protein PPL_00581 [Heterostelium album PN500]EFA86776.1 hypothetical protein PPL_00581 [Heterostelium album PN500]|eukprot:XP_020438880.1 hypothetical protein PPL_00581 [Heterostelium album PN500]
MSKFVYYVPFVVGMLLFFYNTAVYLVVSLVNLTPFPPSDLSVWTGIVYLLPVPYFIFLSILSHDKNIEDTKLKRFYQVFGIVYALDMLGFSIVQFTYTHYAFVITNTLDLASLIVYCIIIRYPAYKLKPLPMFPSVTYSLEELPADIKQKEKEQQQVDLYQKKTTSIEVVIDNQNSQLPIDAK